MQNAILYLAYGNPDAVNQCRYSLLKCLQVYNLTAPAQTAIVVYTDAPDSFADFEPFLPQLSVRKLTSETVQSWHGTVNFPPRLKVEMLLDFLQTFQGNLLCCDADTYITAPLEPIFDNIEGGTFYLHQYEGMIDKRENPSLQRLEQFLSTTPITYHNKTVEFSKNLKMFTTAVIGLNSRHAYLLQEVLALTDAVYTKFPKQSAGQFATSYILQKNGTINTANHSIAHYCQLKEFRKLLQLFFTRNAEESIPNLIKKLHTIDAYKIQEEKKAFERLPLLQKIKQSITGKAWKIARYEKRL